MDCMWAKAIGPKSFHGDTNMRSTMSIQEGFLRSRESQGASLVQSWLSTLFARIAAWRKHMRELEELACMSDRELADVGMSRSDVRSFKRAQF
jgi:uncharacterized protein YjiS (DUF1127 family)